MRVKATKTTLYLTDIAYSDVDLAVQFEGALKFQLF